MYKSDKLILTMPKLYLKRKQKGKPKGNNNKKYWFYAGDIFYLIQEFNSGVGDAADAIHYGIIDEMEEEFANLQKAEASWLASQEYETFERDIWITNAACEEQVNYEMESIEENKEEADLEKFNSGTELCTALEKLTTFISDTFYNSGSIHFLDCTCGYFDIDFNIGETGDFCTCYGQDIPPNDDRILFVNALIDNYQNCKDLVTQDLRLSNKSTIVYINKLEDQRNKKLIEINTSMKLARIAYLSKLGVKIYNG